MLPRICILLNDLDEFNFGKLLNRYLPKHMFEVQMLSSFPDNPSLFELIVPWNYQRIIKNAEAYGNIVVIHSSELPEGRGWAPIYYTFSEERVEYVMSVILAANEVDAGNVIMRARFNLEAEYTAPYIRELDNELSMVLIAKIMNQWPDGDFTAVRQTGRGSYHARRYPCDNEVDLTKTLGAILPHLRGVEQSSPAFFVYKGIKYIIEIRPELTPDKPMQVIFEYPALNKTEVWTRWNDTP